MTDLAPTSRPSDDVTNGKVAQELPVAPALLIRRELAQKWSFVIFRVFRPDWRSEVVSASREQASMEDPSHRREINPVARLSAP